MSTHTDSSNYGYTPSVAWCSVFIALFSLSGLLHIYQAWRAKYWVIFPTLVIGAAVEVLGWSGRLWSSQNVLLLTPFLMQISTLILAPCFFSAWDYVLLGSAIAKLGPQYSLLRPRWYFIVFITADLISIVLQAVGGGQASSSAAEGAPTQSATDIMVAGIIFQLISMVVFVSLGLDFILRATQKRPYAFQARRIAAEQSRVGNIEAGTGNTLESSTSMSRSASDQILQEKPARANELNGTVRQWWILLGAALISSAMIICRGVYRSIELKQGWEGYLITHEIYQSLLDGIPMLIAVGVFNVIHPSYLLPKKRSWKSYHLEE
ncbi:RTA-like protein [Kockovaella imperatae]|uniref:RTA-like protein n=1 Tax=Kockovaella imperatae TaxID=4999 RepID=A0A1Y1UDV1_9TREE|nr:RTA-like protein [Kockovaella imperatae]ORX36221.1 RTA-like protein [Kockovaella imperatae]